MTALDVITAGWLAATACGLVACRAQFRDSPATQAWNLAAALAYMAVALIAVFEGGWLGTGLALFVGLLRWQLWWCGRPGRRKSRRLG